MPRHQLIKLRADDAEIGARHGVVEADDNLAFFHDAAFLDEDLPDDTAVRVLHLFDVRFDDDKSGRDHGAGQLRQRSPSADAEHQNSNGPDPDEIELADRAVQVLSGALLFDSSSWLA